MGFARVALGMGLDLQTSRSTSLISILSTNRDTCGCFIRSSICCPFPQLLVEAMQGFEGLDHVSEARGWGLGHSCVEFMREWRIRQCAEMYKEAEMEKQKKKLRRILFVSKFVRAVRRARRRELRRQRKWILGVLLM